LVPLLDHGQDEVVDDLAAVLGAAPDDGEVRQDARVRCHQQRGLDRSSCAVRIEIVGPRSIQARRDVRDQIKAIPEARLLR